MPLVATSRPQLSDVLLGYSQIEKDSGVNYHFARVTVFAASDTVVTPLGTPIIWDATNDRFEILANADTIPTEATTLPNSAKVGLAVGSQEGVGFNKADVTIGAGGTILHVLFRGPAAVAADGIVFPASVLTATQTVFKNQLEVQGIAVAAAATNVVPSFITA